MRTRTGIRNTNGIVALLMMLAASPMAMAQRVLSLDSCLSMAMSNNKQLGVAKLKQEAAMNLRKSARTKYLPHVQAMGGYLYSSKEISLLTDEQKARLSSIGTTATQGVSQGLQGFAQSLTPEQVGKLDNMLSSFNTNTQQVMGNIQGQVGNLAGRLNAEGQGIVDAFRTDTRNMFAGSVMLTQPIYMGGSIVAMNKMADLGEQLAANSADAATQATLYKTEQTYWTVVSLKHKRKLAEQYLELVKRFNDDVTKMIGEGVATRSDGLSVAVRVNEAEMTLTQVDDGLTLAKMLLCQLCGLPAEEQLTLADEDKEELASKSVVQVPSDNGSASVDNRPELKMLQTTVGLSEQATRLIKAGNLPKVALVGGYSISNPNLFNGFQREFSGMWNVGVLVTVPVWNWGDVTYKARAAKNATAMARLEMDDAREKMDLQVSQSRFKMGEAAKRLSMAQASTKQAEENLRCANLGFKEGVMPTTTVMEAQTAWLKARTQKIDAEIDIKLSESSMRKALGTLHINN